MKFIELPGIDGLNCLISTSHISLIQSADDSYGDGWESITEIFTTGDRVDECIVVGLPYDDVVRHLREAGAEIIKPFIVGR